jgi:TPR repeat protein
MTCWKTILATTAILFSSAVYAQTGGDPPQVRAEAGRADMDETYWKLPNAADLKAYSRAAEEGDAVAQFKLAMMYYSGDLVPQSYTEAANWFRKAAEQGLASAQKNLGMLYGKGQGVPQSDAEAYVWLNLATISGAEGTVNIRDHAASMLSAEDLKAARERVGDLYGEIQQGKAGG